LPDVDVGEVGEALDVLATGNRVVRLGYSGQSGTIVVPRIGRELNGLRQVGRADEQLRGARDRHREGEPLSIRGRRVDPQLLRFSVASAFTSR
jgi:hypothetical protein